MRFLFVDFTGKEDANMVFPANGMEIVHTDTLNVKISVGLQVDYGHWYLFSAYFRDNNATRKT